VRDAHRLKQRLRDREVRVCVLGQGYVGLSVAAGAATAGMEVDGIDVHPDLVAALAEGRLVVPGVHEARFAEAHATGRLRFGTDPSVVVDADVVLVCVPTPLVDHRPDLSAVEAASASVGEHLRPGTLVILESTTYPGTTEQVVRPLLEAGGLRAGRDFLLAYSPERIDPGNTKFGLRETPRVVGGLTSQGTDVAATFYAQLVDQVHPVSSCRAAELAKLLENTYRMVNIALVNELAQLCAEQGIDVWEVIDAAASKPFGFQAFYPGPGIGGHCIPLDPTYLTWQSRRDTGRPFRLVEQAADINAQMPSYVAGRIIDALNDRDVPVRGARIVALGITYKPDVGDIRESAAIEVLARLRKRGADVAFHDPFVERIDEPGLSLRRRRLTDALLESADCVALLTPHSTYDLDHVVASSTLVFDARNATGARAPGHVVRL
jgi:UDP-N-acetyl-D-glucosamine dehydrogenase